MAFSRPLSGNIKTFASDISNWYDPNNSGTRGLYHAGADYTNQHGVGTGVSAISNGKVAHASTSLHDDFGYFVVIQHKDVHGNLLDRYSLYAHLNKIPLVSDGDPISAGQVIGELGGTGGVAPHLHLSLLKLTKAEASNISDASLGFFERDKSIQMGSFVNVVNKDAGHAGEIVSDTIIGDISRTVAGATEIRHDLIIGMGGNDTIDGGSGTDTVEYQEDLESIWFYRSDATTTFSFIFDSAKLNFNILHNIEQLNDNGGLNTINLNTVPLRVLGVGSSSASTKYILPTTDYDSASIDGGGGYDILSVSGTSSSWNTAQTTDGVRLTKISGSSFASNPLAAAPAVQNPVDITNIEAIEFDNGTFTIEELLGKTLPSGTPKLNVRVKAGVEPFFENDSGNVSSYMFEVFSDIALNSSIDVHWKVVGFGPNRANSSDFNGGVYSSGTKRMTAGDLTGRISVNIQGDDIPEFDEEFRVEIWLDSSDSSEAVIVNKYAFGTILNDDGPISLGDDHGDTPETATLLGNENLLIGIIENPTDKDVFTGYLLGGLEYQFFFGGSNSVGTRFDGGVLNVYDENLNPVSYVDTNPSPNQVFFKFSPTESGTYYFEIDSPDNSATGNYQFLYSLSGVGLDGSLPNSLNGITDTLSLANSIKYYSLNGTNFELPAVSFRTDMDLSDLRLTLYGINGHVVSGSWIEVAAGVYNFNFSAPGSDHFTLEVEALNSDSYGTFTVERSFQSWHLPALDVDYNGDATANTIDANGLGNHVHGFGGNDTLFGNSGDDTIFGDNGRDTLFGGKGNDTLNGGQGQDEFHGGDGVDTADYSKLKSGVDINLFLNTASGGNAQGDTFFLIENIKGTKFSDIITGDSSANTILGNSGNDQLRGGNNNDVIRGGIGIDQIYGDDGDDLLYGDDGIDLVYGGQGSDEIHGGLLGDLLYGGGQSDTLFGGGGNDSLFGNAGNDRLFGQDGDDIILAHKGNDYVSGGLGKDTITGSAGNDTLIGGKGNDRLLGGDGTDILQGNGGADKLFGGSRSDVLKGGGGRDKLNGESGADNLFGGSGSDQIRGGAGNDTIFGGSGADLIVGGAGNDLLLGGAETAITDTFYFTGRFGDDRIDDFEIGTDLIEFGIAGLKFTDLTITSVSAGALIEYIDESILLAGIPSFVLSESEFLFSV